MRKEMSERGEVTQFDENAKEGERWMQKHKMLYGI